MKIFVLIFIAFFTFPVESVAQQYLYLQKGNNVPHARFGLNDRVQFKTKENKGWIKGFLYGVTDKTITVGNRVYLLDEIDSFKTVNSIGETIGWGAIAAGVLYVVIVVANSGISSEASGLTENEAWVSGALVASGIGIRLISRKTYRSAKGWKWKVIDFEKNFLDE